MHRRPHALTALIVLMSFALSDCRHKDPDWIQPGIRTGAALFTRGTFLVTPSTGRVTDIEFGELRAPGKLELGVAGEYGAEFFDRYRVQQARIEFEPRDLQGWNTGSEIVKRTSKNPLLFFRHDGGYNAALADSQGGNLWQFPYDGVSSAAFGFVGPDGAPEFFFVDQYGAKDGTVEACDLKGQTIWRREGIARWNSSLALVKLDASGPPALVLDSGTDLLAIDHSGHTIFKHPEVVNLAEFTTVTWPPLCPEQCLIASGDRELFLTSPDGKEPIGRLPALYTRDLRAVAVKFYEDRDPLLAVVGLLKYQGQLVGFKAVRGALYIFDAAGKPVYNEVLNELCQSVAALPSADGKTETLLVGAENKVLEYRPSN
ncbi:MAG TPA: hypothetical protein VFA67_04795 [Candidatus Sulfotelmatobacter sp.]|nr:hypothetical protein [Candidatus Sulfotelmatobacter sp.]